MRSVRRPLGPSSGPLIRARRRHALTDYEQLRKALGDPELDPELLDRALTHRSYAYENGGLPTNERLEFLGDAVLGVVVTETLYLSHPELSEGRLAKLRAAVVNARALAEVGRGIALGEFVKLGRGEETTGGRDKASILSDTVEAVIGAIHLSGGIAVSSTVVHQLFDPLIEAASALGAGLDWKTSLQELAAEHNLGVPEYVIEDEGPDHMKSFTAQVRVGGQLYGNGMGRSKKEAEQAAAETAYGDIATALGVADDRPARPGHGRRSSADSRALLALNERRVPELPEVEVVRAGLAHHVLGATITAVDVRHPRPVRRDPRGPAGFAAALTGRRIEAVRRRGKYLWLPLDNGDALLGHLGMSGQILLQPPDAPSGAAPAGPARVSTVPPTGREIRFVDQRMFGGLSVSAGGAELPPEIAHIARDPLDPEFDDDEFVRRVRRRYLRDQAPAARPEPDLGSRQHLRRRGAVAGPAARRTARRPARRAPGPRAARPRPRGDDRGARPGRHVVRRALRQRQRGVRLLRAVAARLRPRGRAVRAVR